MADLFTYRASTVPMPGLVEVAHHTENRWVHLYCWPCRTVHEFSLKDVERIVYALGMAEVEALHMGGVIGQQTECRELAAFGPSCLREILPATHDGDLFAEHVEQGIECRERADG